MRVVTNELVEHLLRVFSAVEERVDVGLGQLRDASENGLLFRHCFLLGMRERDVG